MTVEDYWSILNGRQGHLSSSQWLMIYKTLNYHQAQVITEAEGNRLVEMTRSQDEESVFVAECILKSLDSKYTGAEILTRIKAQKNG